jgi:hypothetical protein
MAASSYIYKKGEKEKKNWVTQTQIVGVVWKLKS